MNFSLCAPSSDLRYPCKEVLRSTDVNPMMPKPSLRVVKVVKRDVSQVSSNQEAGNLMPKHLQGSFIGKKPLDEHGHKTECVRTLLIDNYDSYTYNIYQELSVINGLPPVVVRNDEMTWEDLYHYLYEENAFDNIVISPGPGTPTCPADIGYVHGANVVHASEPIHGRLRLFQDIPSGPNSGFKVVRYHSLIIDDESLPNELIPIAWTTSTDALSFLGTHELDDTPDTSADSSPTNVRNGGYSRSNNSDTSKRTKVLMGIMHSTRPHYGVQFHPESVATCHGRQIFKNFREITENYWRRLKLKFTKRRGFSYAGHFMLYFLSSKPSLACMQMPNANGLLREVSKGRKLVNYADDRRYTEDSRSGQSMHDADNNSCFRMLNMVDLSHQNIGIKHLKLKWRKFDCFANKVGGARDIFHELFGHHNAGNTFWLDSSSTEKGRARFSFMGGKGGSLWKHVTFKLSDESDTTSKAGGYLTIEDAQGSTVETFLEEGFLDFLRKELLIIRHDEKDYEGLPFDFYGGYIGYIGYNLKVECGMVSNRHKSTTPDACFFFADNLIAIDHCNGDVYAMSLHEGSTTPSWLEEMEQKLLDLEASVKRGIEEQTLQALRSSTSEVCFVCDKSREDYVKDIEKCLDYIKDGESYELCLTTQLRKRIGDIDSLGLYLHLREKNPAPYAAWLNFSRENLSICCSSPERFLRLDRNGVLEAKPIKGTMARGTTQEEDEQRKRQLQYRFPFFDSEKDRAENLMIVDLLRNDLGQVCDPGSVHVPCLMDVESYATVHTMVSTIRGKKREDVTAIDCVRAAFPGGSMTGAPKLRSMELLDRLESSSRGIYSGSIGFFSYNQTFDLNIVIRTIVIHEGEASIGAGGAIVALSNPEDEYEEMILKTSAPAKAVMDFL
ncbi:hypothetical protein TIFTF001_020251 [Ficus carica]|uniref:aminodeoxychorismate synthase n=1 Tax=Ficus carica TaxID=3494 RepID=A0AA88DJK2_FICCA|nr:hypothetical protein TIFTF001_020251 [Ficus carica]